MKIKLTPTCHKQINDLTKKKKLGFSNCKQDIFKEFSETPMSELNLLGSLLVAKPIAIDGKSYYYKKIRVANSKSKTGKRGGYRLYCLISEDNEIIILIACYPKTGQQSRSNLSNTDEFKFLDILIEEASDLVDFD